MKEEEAQTIVKKEKEYHEGKTWHKTGKYMTHVFFGEGIYEDKEFPSFRAAKRYADSYPPPFLGIFILAEVQEQVYSLIKDGWKGVDSCGRIPEYSDPVIYCRPPHLRGK